MSKTQEREILQKAIEIALVKDGRTPYAVAKELGIDNAGFYRMKQGKLFPNARIFLKLRDWMEELGLDLEKMVRDNLFKR